MFSNELHSSVIPSLPIPSVQGQYCAEEDHLFPGRGLPHQANVWERWVSFIDTRWIILHSYLLNLPPCALFSSTPFPSFSLWGIYYIWISCSDSPPLLIMSLTSWCAWHWESDQDSSALTEQCFLRGSYGLLCIWPLVSSFFVFHPLCVESLYGDSTDKPLLDCCACGTAKYRVTFYGNWSEKTHPKDYPREHSLSYFFLHVVT